MAVDSISRRLRRFAFCRSACLYSERVPLHLVEHPLVHDALATLRDAATPPELFRRMAVRISLLLAAEATRDLPAASGTVTTPLGPAPARRVAGDVVVVPVLRAGLGMLDAVLELVPSARVGHIGLQRDELTAVASQYYAKLPRDLGRQLRADDRSDARHRRQRGRRRWTCCAGRAPRGCASSASSPRRRALPSSSATTPTSRFSPRRSTRA